MTHLADLEARLATCLKADQERIDRRLRQAKSRSNSGKPIDQILQSITKQMADSAKKRQSRQRRISLPSYPDLPVAARREEIVATIKNHQVVIISGETGSGKTTQLPKLCLEAGRGLDGFIGHTQPRRIAARSVTRRIAEELGQQHSNLIGYKIRHQSTLSDQALIKVMTDGILLAETRSDARLQQYDTLIIDEAHERSLNIDFLLGYLKRLLPQRPDLKLIITSATIDTQRFADYFGQAPVIEISGRGYPVEIRYAPRDRVKESAEEASDPAEKELPEAVEEAFLQLQREGPGDTLVFLPGEREIHEVAEHLQKLRPANFELLKLYARAPETQQEKIFSQHRGTRIILTTNIAETSLTVPGIRYVIDAGLARISRYDPRSKVQRLPIEKISQASANQRAGRCGRISAGICIRLYTQEDFDRREPFTQPEIVRTSLAAVVLQMRYLNLGDPEAFPFIEAPAKRAIKDAYHTLQELTATDEGLQLTPVGMSLAQMPIDPRLGRMLIAAEQLGSLADVLILCAVLATQDPRERPREKQTQADQAHALLRDKDSDFVSLLNVWKSYQEQKKLLSVNQLRKWSSKQFLSWRRLREWSELHKQLTEMARDMGMKAGPEDVHPDLIHRALLTGLLSNVALKQDQSEYQGARNTNLWIFPGSGLNKSRPQWLMASEMVETSRLYARNNAKIQPQWVEQAAEHLLKRSYTEPHWSKSDATVKAYVSITLYGLPLVTRRAIEYGPIQPVGARELFIRQALVAGEFHTEEAFLQHNKNQIAKVQNLEARQRRQDLLADEESLFAFYDARIPAEVYNGYKFRHWWRQAKKTEPNLLHLDADFLLQDAEKGHRAKQRHPDTIEVAGLHLPLSYHFEPGHPADGVSVTIPIALLNQIPAPPFEWLVPGLLPEKVIALIRNLPKSLRRNFVPVPDFATACLEAMTEKELDLASALADRLTAMTGVKLSASEFQQENLDAHLRMRFLIIDDNNHALASGRDLAQLQSQLGATARQSFHQTINAQQPGEQGQKWKKQRIENWDFADLQPKQITTAGGAELWGWPALMAQGDKIEIQYCEDQSSAARHHRLGFLTLLRKVLTREQPSCFPAAGELNKLALQYSSLGNVQELQAELQQALLKKALVDQALPMTREVFLHQRQLAIQQLPHISTWMIELTSQILDLHRGIRLKIKSVTKPQLLDALTDVQEQLDYLVYRGFISGTPVAWLDQLPRFLKGIDIRLKRASLDPARDRQFRLELQPHWQKFRQHAAAHLENPDWIEYRWMLEEMRISLFAQTLKTSMPISIKRLQKFWTEKLAPR